MKRKRKARESLIDALELLKIMFDRAMPVSDPNASTRTARAELKSIHVTSPIREYSDPAQQSNVS